MKVFTRDYNIAHYSSPLWGEYFGGLKPCVLDIEATGLSPQNCKLVLIALLTETDNGLRVTQFLAENHYEENRVLQAALDFLNDEAIDYLITFNGFRYDIPFINTRLEKLHMDASISMYDFDLYRFLRKCSRLSGQLESMSQASLEKFYGIASDRKDTISGRESVSLYNEYAVTANSTLEKIILTHNREDVVQLYRLLKLAGTNDFSEVLRGDSQEAYARFGLPVCLPACTYSHRKECSGDISAFSYDMPSRINSKVRYSIRPSIVPSKKLLRICGDQLGEPVSAAFFPDVDSSVTATFSASSSSLEISVPIQEHSGSFYLDMHTLGYSSSMLKDTDCINGFLILNSRTVNLLAIDLTMHYDSIPSH